MSPLKIGICVIEFPTPSETFIVTKVLGLLAAGFDVHIFAMRPSRFWERFDVLRDRDDVRARIHVSPSRDSWRTLAGEVTRSLLANARRDPRQLARYIVHNIRARRDNGLGWLRGLVMRLHFLGHDLDILHIEFDMQANGLVDLKDFLGARVLLSSRGTVQRTAALENYPDTFKYAFTKVDAYHFISKYLQANTHRLGLDPTLVPEWLIEPAIDLTLFQPPPPRERGPGEPLRILSVSRLAWEKGYEFAIDAIGKVHRAGIPVVYSIIGEGPYREPIIYAARQQGLWDAGIVRLVGAVPREAIVGHYRTNHVMLHAALEEGFCNAVIEAQAMELPVVTSDVGGLPENVADGVSGYVVRQRDSDAMAARLIELARDDRLRHELGRGGRARARARFDLADQIPKFSALYLDMARRLPRKSDAS